MFNFKKLLFLLTPKEVKYIYLLILLMLLTALLELTSVVSLFPFMSVLTNPEIIETNSILKNLLEISKKFGVQNDFQFLIYLGVLVLVILIFSLIFRVFSAYAIAKFAYMCEHHICERLIKIYMYQPYSWFLNKNSSEIENSILSEVSHVVGNGLKPFMDLIAKTLVAIAIMTLLIVAEPKVSLIVGSLLIILYLLMHKLTSHYLNLIGKKRLKNNLMRFKTVSESFGAAKEIKAGALEDFFIKEFYKPSLNYAENQTSVVILSSLPRFVAEGVAYIGIMIVVFYLILKTGNFNSVVPIISLYIFATFRLMPTLQGIYSAFSQLAFVGSSLDNLYNIHKNTKVNNLNKNQNIILFNKSIKLKNICYNYPNSSRTILRDVSLSIPARSTVGFIGATGSGKTTLVDIILNLLEAKIGTLEVDEEIITWQNSKAWRQSIGYVPQHIYLSDNTISSNIAFGIDTKDINQEAVENASRIANIHNFIINDLPQKYQTTIGERGVRLSGGQRQRIGIARALYHIPKLLILDEATSALDTQTEDAVMKAINNLKKKITIIIIAHRLNTVKNCDIIFKLDNGQILKQGIFDDFTKNI